MLELANVSVAYAGRSILRDVSLRLEPGRIHTIVGRNGCGKSTLLKTCAGLLAPSCGSVLLEGQALHQYPPAERAKRLSYLAQSRSTPALSVERLVGHGRYPRLAAPRRLGEDDRRSIQAAMEKMQVEHLRNQMLGGISGGECQRVYLAMLLAQDAPIMLLDEPTAFLDIEHQLALMELLQELRREQKCIVMVLHDLALALNCSDTIIAIDDGRIVSCAAPEAMLAEGTLERIFHVRIQAAGTPGKNCLLNIEKGAALPKTN